jgi:hypothetical protein
MLTSTKRRSPKYQEDRLREKAAPKSINEEVRFLLKMLGYSGEVIRAHLRKKKQPATKFLILPHQLRHDAPQSQVLCTPARRSYSEDPAAARGVAA